MHLTFHKSSYFENDYQHVIIQQKLSIAALRSFLYQPDKVHTRSAPNSNYIQIPTHLQISTGTQLQCLRRDILHGFKEISHAVSQPRIIQCGHPTLQKILRAKLKVTDEQLIDIHLTTDHNLNEHSSQPTVTTPAQYTIFQKRPTRCRHPRCATYRYFNTNFYFTNTKTRRKCRIRQPFNCKSSNIIYVITCRKCKNNTSVSQSKRYEKDWIDT